eukprot:2088010-Pleurochrysis_carterae.AAC.2
MKAIELSGTVYREAANMIMWESNAVPGFRIGRQYMSRAWTLAERIQRRKKRLTVRGGGGGGDGWEAPAGVGAVRHPRCLRSILLCMETRADRKEEE